LWAIGQNDKKNLWGIDYFCIFANETFFKSVL
jgi:hypothetical protein